MTKKHCPIENSFDEKIFLDSDLLILGEDENKYNEYMLSIRKEYEWVDDYRYNTNRIGILKEFLKKNTIYLTCEFRDLYESQARKNIQSEIDLLNKFISQKNSSS